MRPISFNGLKTITQHDYETRHLRGIRIHNPAMWGGHVALRCLIFIENALRVLLILVKHSYYPTNHEPEGIFLL